MCFKDLQEFQNFSCIFKFFFIYLIIACLYLTLLFKRKSVILTEKLFYELNYDLTPYKNWISSYLVKKFFVMVLIDTISLLYEIYYYTTIIVLNDFSYRRLFKYISILIFNSIINYLMLLFCLCCEFITYMYVSLKEELVTISSYLSHPREKRRSVLTSCRMIDKFDMLMTLFLKINSFRRKSINLLGLCVALIYCFIMVTVVTDVSVE